jgi:ribonuclease R
MYERMKKKRSKQREQRTSERRISDAYQPSDVLQFFQRKDERIDWPELRSRAAARRPADVDRLRRVVSGLVHTGELVLDERGRYRIASRDGDVIGKVVAQERGPLLVEIIDKNERWPIRGARDLRLRANDIVKARVEDDEAIVTKIVERSSNRVIGRLVTSQGRPYVTSENPDYSGRVYVDRESRGAAEDGDAVALEVTGDDGTALFGRIVEVLARHDDRHIASTTLLYAYDVPTEWPLQLEAEIRALPTEVAAAGHAGRVDLTDLPLVTIDGEDARDFDDAVYCEPRRGGGWRLVVAIADVAHYVRPDTVLDAVAWQRGNSVYLPDRVVPMLPEALSNDLCSLRPHVPRLCLVCDMSISAKGRISGYRFYDGVMHSAARLTYTTVARFLEGATTEIEPMVQGSLRHLYDVFRALLMAREERGALDFDSREQKLELLHGRLERIARVVRNDAHRLIEEAMIAANVCAARFIERPHAGAAALRALYRIHEGPTPEKWEQLRQWLALAAIRADGTTPTPLELKRLVDRLAGRSDRWLYESLVLRSMSQAVYSPHNVGHYGLALPKYMHFTSPIRRYADLVVHRVIKAALAKEEAPHQEMDWLVATGEHVSLTERRADEVSREVANWLKCEYAARFIGDTFTGTVIGITDFGLFVELDGIYLQGLVHVSNLGEDFYRFHPGRLALIGERSGHRFGLGDTLDVVLADVDPEGRKIDLRLPNGVRGRRKKGGRRR